MIKEVSGLIHSYFFFFVDMICKQCRHCDQMSRPMASDPSLYCLPRSLVGDAAINEPPHDKSNKMACAPSRLRSAWASVQSNQSHCCPHEESLGL